ncbi:MAG: hypothetical protein GY852_09040 [bacterium]|nr:hypothetical protein [bacterium]
MYEINVYYSGADNFFFSDARALPDIGYYLFIFSCILAIYCINNRDFLKEK